MSNRKAFSWGNVTWDGTINVDESPASKSADMVDQADFKCIRVVANLRLTRTTPGPLDPPVKVSVNVMPGDGNINYLKVAYWRGGWTVLPIESRTSSSVTVIYDKNGDPPIAVGN